MMSSPEPELSSPPEPAKEPPKPEEVKVLKKPPEEVKKLSQEFEVTKLSAKEMLAEVAKTFRSEWASHVPSVEDIATWRSEWLTVRESRLQLAKEINKEHEKRVKEGQEEERKKSVKAKERTAEVLESKRVASGPVECDVCKKPVIYSSAVAAVRYSDGHLAHFGCQDENRCEGCLGGTGFNILAETARELMMIVGHGSDSGSFTFVPPGMTVYTFAAPGVGLPFEDGALVLMQPKIATKVMTFGEWSKIPNMEIDPLTEAQEDAMRNVYLHVGGPEDEVDWVSDDGQRLCAADHGECIPPFHACGGLLQTYRGTKELYLVTCAGDAMPDPYSAENLGYERLMRLIMAQGKEAPNKALSFYNSLSDVLKAILQLDADFVSWYDKTLKLPES